MDETAEPFAAADLAWPLAGLARPGEPSAAGDEADVSERTTVIRGEPDADRLLRLRRMMELERQLSPSRSLGLER